MAKNRSKFRPLILAVIVLLSLPGAYWLNITGRQIVYQHKGPAPAPYAESILGARVAREYKVFQHASEFVFWPAEKVHDFAEADAPEYEPRNLFERRDLPILRDEWR